MSLFLFDVNCPSCGSRCWINNGDVSDQTVSDAEAAKCWQCHAEFKLDEDDDEPISNKLIEDTYQYASQAAVLDNDIDRGVKQ